MPTLTITSEDNEVTYSNYTGSGPLSFTFAHAEKLDVNVDVDGVTLAQSAWVHTPVVYDGGNNGGTVTLVTPVAGADVRIWRDMVRLRASQFGVGGANPRAVDAEFNRLVLMAQDARSAVASPALLAAIEALGDLGVDDLEAIAAGLAGKADKNIANTLTKPNRIELAAAETGEALVTQVGTSAAPRTIQGAFGYFANRTLVYGAPDNTGNGIQTALFAYSNFPSGQGAIAIGLLAKGEVSGTWTTGTFESGAQGLWGEAYSSRGGTLFGAYFGLNRSVTAGGLSRLAEFDAFRSVNDQSLVWLELASPEANKGTITGSLTIDGGDTITDGAGLRYNVITGGTGPGIKFPYGIMAVKPSGGAAPIENAIIIAGGYELVHAFNFKSLTFSGAGMYFGNNQKILRVRNAANSADLDILKVDASNRIDLYNSKLLVNANGAVTQNLSSQSDAFTSIRVNTDGNGEKYLTFRGVNTGVQALEWKIGIYNNTGDIGAARYNDTTDAFLGFGWWSRRTDGAFFVPGAAARTTASASNAFMDSGTGELLRSTSADEFKTGAEDLDDNFALKIVEAFSDTAIYYRSLCNGDNPNWGWYGVSANRLAEKVPQLALYQTSEVRHTQKTRKVKKLVESVRTIKVMRRKQREVEVDVVDSRDKAELAARQVEAAFREMAKIPPLPDDGWKPRMSKTTRIEDVFTLVPEIDPETGEPVYEDVPETDPKTGRYIIENGQTRMKREQRMAAVYEEEEVEIEEPFQEEIEFDEPYIESEVVELEKPKVSGAAYERAVVALARVLHRALSRIEVLEAR
ncbi:MAG: hypothetical protein B7Z37_27875 [Verrucomicrobia bacterium 12-59-8]|nr:MAG: hypothetical protein B7Z37_27875 [Verrucomicrobia bacterium 12-59-8]